MMICVVIKGPTFEEAQLQIEKALAFADLVELRLDFFTEVDIKALTLLKSECPIPMIFTVRSFLQGGVYRRSEEERLDLICQIAALLPDYLDLESHIPAYFIEQIKDRYPEIKIILSYHNFEKTPENLEEIYQEMQSIPAHFYKIAVMAHSTLDALRLLCWSKESTQEHLTVISMGQYGQISRILSPIIGNLFTYAALEEGSLPLLEQLSAKTLTQRYRHPFLTSKTAVYGLIGDPVSLSISDETHNRFFEMQGWDAVYVKMQVKPFELKEFLKLSKKLPFKGFSITMPLKEEILAHLEAVDCIAREIGAVNTLVLQEGHWIGYNTDAKGALNAVEDKSSVLNKRVVIIGTGGAAKAIAYEANQRGALLTIVSREESKAKGLADRFQGEGKELAQMKEVAKAGYDLLINCTPLEMPIDFEDLFPGALVMDVKTKPKETLLLQAALRRGCEVIYGYHMFVWQALDQFTYWFGKGKVEPQEALARLLSLANALLDKKDYRENISEVLKKKDTSVLAFSMLSDP